jgi:hypothetical protein
MSGRTSCIVVLWFAVAVVAPIPLRADLSLFPAVSIPNQLAFQVDVDSPLVSSESDAPHSTEVTGGTLPTSQWPSAPAAVAPFAAHWDYLWQSPAFLSSVVIPEPGTGALLGLGLLGLALRKRKSAG